MFVDEVKVYAAAGHGGAGCVAFQREKFRPKGGPSGGNGGRGASVILKANHDINNLIAQFYTPRLIGPNGEPGKGKGMDGHAGKDLIVKVPCGTQVWKLPAVHTSGHDSEEGVTENLQGEKAIVYDLEGEGADADETQPQPLTGVPEGKGELVADLVDHDQEFLLCQGGRGGMGNRNFATARRQTPRFAQPGEPGEEGWFRLELRLMADVGLVGYPNAGKSTLISAISKARPKIAPYPFTTLHPQIGIVEFEDYERLIICDVPGIIEGAHDNVGLGHKFLRHIQRCRLLVLLIDMAGTDGRDPWDDHNNLVEELRLYDPELAEKPRLVVANKMDEPTAADLLKKFKRHIPKTEVIPIAAAFDQGLEPLKNEIRKVLNR